ncbi:hypothetical protein [Streptomyces sp. TP-A0356]|uniref:hypothetical protein n=1 Tax=Streptomyces sp. TP-A0356 TaxID=1359208 RepID=UPI0006E2DFCB|nr:hypothetical protein [Streptomyces sp. TP-A0356]
MRIGPTWVHPSSTSGELGLNLSPVLRRWACSGVWASACGQFVSDSYAEVRIENLNLAGVERMVGKGQCDLSGFAWLLTPVGVGVDGPDSADHSAGNHDE